MDKDILAELIIFGTLAIWTTSLFVAAYIGYLLAISE